MVKRLAALLIVLSGLAPLVAGGPEDIRDMLSRQVAEWNRGDIEKFVSYYTDDCIFAGTELHRGRANVLARYRKAYPNREAMGKTTFVDVEVQMLDDKYAKVFGRWRLERSESAGGNTGGLFTLLVQRQGHRWLIFHDHTTVAK